MVKVNDYLKADSIAFIEGASRQEVIESLLQIAESKGYVKDIAEFKKAISIREKLVTTSIGMGVAIPHAKLPSFDDFFIVVGILKNGVDWDALDGASVRLVFMIGGPDDKQTEYLQILSGLTLALKDEERRKKLLNSQDVEEIIELFLGF